MHCLYRKWHTTNRGLMINNHDFEIKINWKAHSGSFFMQARCRGGKPFLLVRWRSIRGQERITSAAASLLFIMASCKGVSPWSSWKIWNATLFLGSVILFCQKQTIVDCDVTSQVVKDGSTVMFTSCCCCFLAFYYGIVQGGVAMVILKIIKCNSLVRQCGSSLPEADDP